MPPSSINRCFGLFCKALAVLCFLTAVPLGDAAAASDKLKIVIGYMHVDERVLALSVLDIPPPDDGVAGAEIGISDNNTTGSFLNQEFILETAAIEPGEDPLGAFEDLVAKGARYVVTDLPAADLLKVADAAREENVLVFNAGATDTRLRQEDCRANVFHTAPTRAMLADGLAQYLVWKKWRRWLLVYGSHERDGLWADALRRAAERFGARIVEEREFVDTGGARQTDTGLVQIQRQLPLFLQGAADHDVLVAADESEVFATYLPYHTWVPRPVAGSAGLRPSSWHPAHEQWGARQLQNRFLETAGRRMRAKDMQAWTAVRIVGEAATRTGSADPQAIGEYIRSPDFSIAAFKGQALTFRNWNWQLRQPILLSDGRAVISVSPQEGFLHRVSELDTLGTDEPETACDLGSRDR